MTDAAFTASYSDLKLVKTRGVCQIVLELDITQAERFIAAFGIPNSAKEKHVAIAALLNNPAPAADPRQPPSPLAGAGERSKQAKERYASAPPWTKDAMRASILCGDAKFQAWLRKHAPLYVAMISETAEMTAARTVRGLIGAKTRAEIATDETVRGRFIALETTYRQETDLAAEPRE